MLVSEFASCLTSYLPTSPIIGLVKSPLQEWIDSDLVVIEMPLLEFGKTANHLELQRLTNRLAQLGVKVLLVITPQRESIRRRRLDRREQPDDVERPIRKWNDWPYSPLQLQQVCLCNLSAGSSNQHIRYYAGATFEMSGSVVGGCLAPADPSLAPNTPDGVQQGLCGLIRYVSYVLGGKAECDPPRLVGEQSGFRSTPGHIAAPLVHRDFSPVGGASADTRLAEAHTATSPATAKAGARNAEQEVKAFPTDSKERENRESRS